MTEEKVEKTTPGNKIPGPLESTLKREARIERLNRNRRSRTTVKVSKEASAKGKVDLKPEHKKPKTDSVMPRASRITAPKGAMIKAAGKTLFAPTINNERKWVLIDAQDKIVGRLATEISMILRGKNKASYTPNNDVGDFVVVINADKVKFSTQAKENNKMYYNYSGYVGGLRERSAADLREKCPEEILRHAVKGMITRSPLGNAQMKKLKIYAGPEHENAAQNPQLHTLRA